MIKEKKKLIKIWECGLVLLKLREVNVGKVYVFSWDFNLYLLLELVVEYEIVDIMID